MFPHVPIRKDGGNSLRALVLTQPGPPGGAVATFAEALSGISWSLCRGRSACRRAAVDGPNRAKCRTMKGAPTRAIQELAGHRDLTTTQRYMHLSPDAIFDAIRLLERPSPVPACGDIVETADR